MPPALQQGAERFDVVGADLTAATNDAGAGLQPLGGELRVLLWIKVMSGFQHIDHTARFQCVDGRKAIRVSAKRKTRFSQDGNRLGDGLRLGAINNHRQRLEAVDGFKRIGKWLSGAQKLAVVVSNGEPKQLKLLLHSHCNQT